MNRIKKSSFSIERISTGNPDNASEAKNIFEAFGVMKLPREVNVELPDGYRDPELTTYARQVILHALIPEENREIFEGALPSGLHIIEAWQEIALNSPEFCEGDPLSIELDINVWNEVNPSHTLEVETDPATESVSEKLAFYFSPRGMLFGTSCRERIGGLIVFGMLYISCILIFQPEIDGHWAAALATIQHITVLSVYFWWPHIKRAGLGPKMALFATWLMLSLFTFAGVKEKFNFQRPQNDNPIVLNSDSNTPPLGLGDLPKDDRLSTLEDIVPAGDLEAAKRLVKIGLISAGEKYHTGWPLTRDQAKAIASNWDEGTSILLICYKESKGVHVPTEEEDEAGWRDGWATLYNELKKEIVDLGNYLKRHHNGESVPQLIGRFERNYPELFHE